MRHRAIGLSLILLACSPLWSDFYSWQTFLGLKKSPEVKTLFSFQGLSFRADVKTTVCVPDASYTILTCQLYHKDAAGRVNGHLIMGLRKNVQSDEPALALLRLNRKQEWERRFPGLNQYVEEFITVGEFTGVSQSARYFRLDNSFWPVLIRAFDVVVHDKTSISVTTMGDQNDWPLMEKDLEGILTSFAKTVKR